MPQNNSGSTIVIDQNFSISSIKQNLNSSLYSAALLFIAFIRVILNSKRFYFSKNCKTEELQ